MAVGFAVTDDGLDGRAPPQFASDLAVDAALLAGLEDSERFGCVVALVALVDVGALDLAPVSAWVSSITSRKLWPS